MAQRMKHIISRIIPTGLFMLMALPALWAPAGAQESSDGEPAFRVHIRMDRFTFFSDEPVVLHLHVTNNAAGRVSFRAFDELYSTYRPVVYDMNGREAETTVPYRLMNKRLGDILSAHTPRTVELDAGESFVYTIDLRRLYSLPENRSFRVKGFFFPDAANPAAVPGENTIQFRVVREHSAAKKSGVDRLPRGIAPAEIVTLMLQAEKAGRWQTMMKYIKVDSFIAAFPEFSNNYSRADEREKLILEEDFIRFLSKRRSDYILDFTILNESIREQTSAFVDVRIERFGPRLPLIYRYRYRLERHRDYWLVTNVEVSVIKVD